MPRPSSLREQPFRPSAPLGELTDDIESESPRRAALFYGSDESDQSTRSRLVTRGRAPFVVGYVGLTQV